jgi:hypothetical protein
MIIHICVFRGVYGEQYTIIGLYIAVGEARADLKILAYLANEVSMNRSNNLSIELYIYFNIQDYFETLLPIQ